MLTSRAYGGSRETSLPPSSTVPSSGRSKPAITRSVVVLPEPEGPSIVKNSPRADLQVDAVDRGHVSVALAQPGHANVDLSLRRQRTVRGGEAAVELRVRDGQRGQQPEHVAVETAREQEQAPLEGRGGHGLGEVWALVAQLEREHRAEAAHLADLLVARGKVVEPGAHETPSSSARARN